MMPKTSDILVIGGGIIGMATALEAQKRQPKASIILMEKEPAIALHQSGRNSGVIHAGIYYPPGSLKARFCREGSKAIKAFCTEHQINFEECGKLIVATNEREVARLSELEHRSNLNNIKVEMIDEAMLQKLEPNINGLAALYSPSTGITDYRRITSIMADLFTARGGRIFYDTHVRRGDENETSVKVSTNDGTLTAGQVITCGGLYSDRIISSFGIKPSYRIIPFRGEFFRLKNQSPDLVQHLIYPVPDPSRPFLGIHITRKLDGGFTVGPNAILAFGREGYRWWDMSFNDLSDTMTYSGFWRMMKANSSAVASEIASSLSRRVYLRRIQKYCPHIKLNDLAPYPAGIRAQAVTYDGQLVDDFLFIKGHRSLHVGNAPSPAATAAIPIANHIADTLNL